MLRFFGLSDVGRKRTQNEDAFLVSDEHQFAILADGMGGRTFGEVASAMVVENLGNHIREDMPASIERLEMSDQAVMAVNLLDEWIRDANAAVFARGVEDESYQEMGTTVVVLLGLGRQVILGSVGDSRIYRFSGGPLEQLTEDHSFVNSQVKAGVLTEEEARQSNQRNIITRALGTSEKVKADITIQTCGPGDRFLLCSDGLTDMIPDDELSSIMERKLDLEQTATALVSAANAAGGVDNITVVLAEVVD